METDTKESGRKTRKMEKVFKTNILGVCKYANGGKYDGQWVDDQKSGEGVYEYPNGDEYSGEWANDMRDGKGRE